MCEPPFAGSGAQASGVVFSISQEAGRAHGGATIVDMGATRISRLRLKVNKVFSLTLPVRSFHFVRYAFVASIRLDA